MKTKYIRQLKIGYSWADDWFSPYLGDTKKEYNYLKKQFPKLKIRIVKRVCKDTIVNIK